MKFVNDFVKGFKNGFNEKVGTSDDVKFAKVAGECVTGFRLVQILTPVFYVFVILFIIKHEYLLAIASGIAPRLLAVLACLLDKEGSTKAFLKMDGGNRE